MNRLLIIVIAMELAGVLYGAPARLPPAAERWIGEIVARAQSNDFDGAAAAWRKVDLRNGDPAETIRAAAKAVPALPAAKELRREMATKHRLLADDAAPLPPELDDIAPFDVPVVEVEAIVISGLRYTVLDVITLQPDVLRALGIQVPVVDAEIIQIDNARFCELMRLWESRYARQIDYRDAAGKRLVPMPGTVLWRERNAVIQAVEAGGDYDALWDAYNARLAAAIHRRENLKRERR